ncbi:hypothetical protein CCACVL1_11979 [Corchorus capsularis]|uniref:Uncharacterized protein n=1 Tax=Corchorus capsularis TaxID=210143 RepID=A0A1R3IIJ0_COCAP|nr:hypothetical protein CCACVL1_11979 [Corchorus capsularis]
MATFHHLLHPPTTSSPPSFRTLVSINGKPKFFSSHKRYYLNSPFLCFSSKTPSPSADNNPSNFCIIEGPETVQDFEQMQLQLMII